MAKKEELYRQIIVYSLINAPIDTLGERSLFIFLFPTRGREPDRLDQPRSANSTY